MKSSIVSKTDFASALMELGHDPIEYQGKKLSLSGMSELYDLDQNAIIDAIDAKLISAHYDYRQDTIWIDALEAAYFYYCLNMDGDLTKQRAA
jgi:hypothetical protein